MDKYFKAFIRVVKTFKPDISNFTHYQQYNNTNIVEERLIIAKDKEEVKKILANKYPQFFPNNKVYSKETKDDAQFFYVVIFELYQYEKDLITTDSSWECSFCNHKHENEYISRPRRNERLFGDLKFCKSSEDYCINEYTKKHFENIDLPDDKQYINKDSVNYIYKITEKTTNKCYIGKTKNAPFFRWWNHLTHSSSPFGLYLSSTKLSDWTFEVLEILPSNILLSEILLIESKYIKEYDSINNGYNTLISNKTVNEQTI